MMTTEIESLGWDGGEQVVIEGEMDTVGFKGFVSVGKSLYWYPLPVLRMSG